MHEYLKLGYRQDRFYTQVLYAVKAKLKYIHQLKIYSNKTEWLIAWALRWSIFIVQKLALHKNGVEFRQQFIGDIRTSLTATYDDVRRCAMSPKREDVTYKGVIGCASTEALRPSSHPMICSKIVNFDRTEAVLT